MSGRVGVFCYDGDADQVRGALPLYLQHGWPVTVVSPEDSPAVIDHPGVESRFAGSRGGSVTEVHVKGEAEPRVVAKGHQANMRVVAQMACMLGYPEEWFFLNDSDSFSLAPEFPTVLYSDNNTIWCGVAPVGAEHYWNAPPGLPHFALQPPFFLHRKALARMVEVGPTVNDPFPWIDHFILHMAWKAGVTYKSLPLHVGADTDRVPGALAAAVNGVRNHGAIFIHSSKFPATRDPLIQARRDFLTSRRR